LPALDTISSLIGPLKQLLSVLKDLYKKRKIVEKLYHALSSELESYLSAYERAIETVEEQIFPLLRSIDSDPSRYKIIQVVRAVADLFLVLSEIIETFVKVAKACKDVASFEMFMKHLSEADYRLFDFVKVMAESVKDDTMVINSKFYRFIKMYGDDFIKGKIEDIEKAIGECKPYIDIVRKYVKPNISKSYIPKKTVKQLVNSYRKLRAATRKVKISKTETIDLKRYVPLKLLPIVLLYEEFLS